MNAYEHVPLEKGQAFLSRCINWWEACYAEAKTLKLRLYNGGIPKRRAHSEEVREPDAKRLLIEPDMSRMDLGRSGKESLGSVRRSGLNSSRGLPPVKKRSDSRRPADDREGRGRPVSREFRDNSRGTEAFGRLNRVYDVNMEDDYRFQSDPAYDFGGDLRGRRSAW